MKVLAAITILFTGLYLYGQDSLPLKIKHAEPINIDLIRDLGARKGEKEINIGWGVHGTKSYIDHSGFIEYEFAPINRLGLEVEVPFHFYQTTSTGDTQPHIPGHRIEGLKLAVQYTALVSAKAQLSIAFGYLHQFKAYPFTQIKKARSLFQGQAYNPIFIIAKKWGKGFHTLLYTGPSVSQTFRNNTWQFGYDINISGHYMLPNGSNFMGIESNISFQGGSCTVVLHPQTKLNLAEGIALGLATGIPLSFDDTGISFIARLIYEPGKKRSKP